VIRKVRPPAPWRYAIMIAGDRDDTGGLDPWRRLRILDAPVVALRCLLDSVRISGGEGAIGESRESETGPGRIADGFFQGAEPLLRSAANHLRDPHPDLSVSMLKALDNRCGVRPDHWRCRDLVLDLRKRPLIMGILNLTPDSFSDGGRFVDSGLAAEEVFKMAEQGADIVDLGGESTRPGAERLSPEEEWARVQPALNRIAGRLNVPISIDTYKASVACRAIDSGAEIINDITALTGDPEMLPLAIESNAGVVLMHMRETPATMQQNPQYDDVAREVFLFLHRRARACIQEGVEPDRIAIDPGIGFGKTLEHNLDLIRQLGYFTSCGLPVLSGPSRKSFLGKILDAPASDRLEGTIAAVVASVLNGASIVRVHDVLPVARAIKVAAAIQKQNL